MLYLYHYFEKERSPFLTLSDLPEGEAEQVHLDLQEGGNVFALRNQAGDYMFHRRIVEERMTKTFLKKGGKPQRNAPYYLVLSDRELDECAGWFKEPDYIKIPLDAIDKSVLSFTYGDSFPVFAPIFPEQPDYELYLYDEIMEIVKERGLPPARTPDMSWLEKTYIEAQLWSDEPIAKYKK